MNFQSSKSVPTTDEIPPTNSRRDTSPANDAIAKLKRALDHLRPIHAFAEDETRDVIAAILRGEDTLELADAAGTVFNYLSDEGDLNGRRVWIASAQTLSAYAVVFAARGHWSAVPFSTRDGRQANRAASCASPALRWRRLPVGSGKLPRSHSCHQKTEPSSPACLRRCWRIVAAIQSGCHGRWTPRSRVTLVRPSKPIFRAMLSSHISATAKKASLSSSLSVLAEGSSYERSPYTPAKGCRA